MKFLFTCLFFLFFYTASLFSQNNTSNYWRVWYPEVNLGLTSDAPQGAFAVRATENELGVVVGNASADNCNSYTIGNDRRGYVYYDNNASGASKLLRIIDPGTNTVINSIDYSGVTPTIGVLHTVNSFYISATNKHYVVLSGIGASSATPVPTVVIYDVTNVAAPVFEKSISIPNLVAWNGTSAVTPRVTGLVLNQTTYTSASVTMYLAIDNLKRTGATVITGSTYPGIFAKITDPLNASPVVNVYDAMYNTTDYFGGAGTGSFGPHQLDLDEANNILYLTTERNKKILAFDVSGATPTPTNIVYTVSDPANGGSAGNTTLGYHGIYVSRDGTTFYTGRSGVMVAGTDRALKFTRRTTAGTYTEDAHKELSGTTDPLVKGVNLTPDEQYLYGITYTTPAKVFLLDKNTLDTIAVQNPATAAAASFFRLDPHTYAYTLHDYGDAPSSYGAAGHHLVNQDYIQDRLRIGATVDGDTLTMHTATCNGDDGSVTPKTNDEDGLSAAMKSALPGLWNGQTGSYTINNITVKNTTANAAKLIGWIDFDHSGTFDADEAATVAVPINTTSVNLSWTIPSDVNSGPVYIRLRLSTDASLVNTASSTVLFDGEAEDHYIPPVPISGNIFNDVNANTILGAGENNITTLTLYVYVVKNGVIVDSAHVLPDGTYSFANAAQNMASATIVLATNSLAPGTAASSITNVATNPPAGWVYTGESSGGTTGGTDGILNINLATTAITQQNFGLQRVPESAVNLQPTTGNPGGFNSASVPAGAFQTSNVGANPNTQDYDGGTVNNIRITAFPSNANSITINGVVYTNGGTCPPATTCTPWPGGGVTVPYTNGVGPTQAISVDPIEGNVDVVIPFVSIDNTGAEDPTPGSVTIPFRTISLSGTVFNDLNGNAASNGSPEGGEAVINGTNAGGGLTTGAVLYANLIDANGKVIATVPIASDGTYNFPNVPQSATGLTVQLSTNQGVVGQNKPATALPTGWVTTGENKNGQGGAADGTPNGEIPVTTSTTNITTQNFGIQQVPESAVNSQVIGLNPGGTVNTTVNPNWFATSNVGANPNTQDYNGGTVENIRITAFPSNATSITINGVTYTSGTWPVGGVTVPAPGGVPSQTITVDPVDGRVTVVIPFVAIDNAGKEDPTPGSVTLIYTSILPVKLISFNATTSNCNTVLSWKSATETGLSNYVLEYSFNNQNYKPVTTLVSKGDNSSYSALHTAEGNAYYRLKMIEIDGSVVYSNTVFVKIDCKEIAAIINSNPVVNGNLSVTLINTTGKVQAKLISSLGQIMQTQVLNNGVNLISTKKLSAGIYYLQLSGDNIQKSYKVEIK